MTVSWILVKNLGHWCCTDNISVAARSKVSRSLMVIEQARWRLDSPLRRARGRRPLLLAQQVRRDALQQNQARYIVHVLQFNCDCA